MIYYPGDVVEVLLNHNPKVQYVVVRKIHHTGGEFEYSLVHLYDINKPNAVMGPYKDNEIRLIARGNHPTKRFVKEFDLQDIVLTSIDHRRTIGKIVAIKTSYLNSRIQYQLDTSNRWFYASQLKDCKGGI